jgi:asparagine synthase (glutamine-hydrolysing)
MCGIAGYFSATKGLDEVSLAAMTNSLQHRGPDSSGYFRDDFAGLGHRRLSIIDLSARANQPMISSNSRYVIVYNGEVYNYREIGAMMSVRSDQSWYNPFRSSSDTEIILEGFSKWGVDVVHQLNGMFAFAIYDKQEHALYLYRDRIGIKPVYYYWDGSLFVFASELKALKAAGCLNLTYNQNALYEFMHLGYIPAPRTCYQNVFKLPAASYIKIDVTGMQIFKYYDIKQKLSNSIITDKSQAMVMLSDLMTSSVQYQLKSDVPFGVFLSGGIDSSLVTAQATMLSGIKVKTFSIGFEEFSHNESTYAKAVASYLDTDHHEFIVSVKDAVSLIDKMLSIYDEPFGDSSAIPTMLISRLARNYVTVSLSGEGGDELFFGYGFYRWARRLSNPALIMSRKMLASVFARMSSRYQRVSRILDYHSDSFMPGHIFSQEQYYFSMEEIRSLANRDILFSIKDDFLFNDNNVLSFSGEVKSANKVKVSERKLTPMEIQALFDLQFYLPDDLLTKVDRASMNYSLETRVPYLDHRVLEFALNLSPSLKYHHGTSKYILKEILYKYLPEQLFERPKQGFAIPLNKWLGKEMKFLLDVYLDEAIVKKHGYVDSKKVKVLVKKYLSGTEYLFNRLWLLIVLHHWLENNKMSYVAETEAGILKTS